MLFMNVIDILHILLPLYIIYYLAVKQLLIGLGSVLEIHKTVLGEWGLDCL
jgi:hypothetical protein